jgi:hypothetical protein
MTIPHSGEADFPQPIDVLDRAIFVSTVRALLPEPTTIRRILDDESMPFEVVLTSADADFSVEGTGEISLHERYPEKYRDIWGEVRATVMTKEPDENDGKLKEFKRIYSVELPYRETKGDPASTSSFLEKIVEEQRRLDSGLPSIESIMQLIKKVNEEKAKGLNIFTKAKLKTIMAVLAQCGSHNLLS